MGEIFRRVEKKYIITQEQYEKIQNVLQKNMIEDSHGCSMISNIYFDNDQFVMARHSIEKPIYKDKIRIRSYNTPNLNDTIFWEIKRKFDGIVGKRRIGITLEEFYKVLDIKKFTSESQISREIAYYINFYNLKPVIYLSYFRRAYYDKANPDFRITFDNNVITRNYDLQLEKGSYGDFILSEDKYLMEIKTLGSIPIEIVKELNSLKIAPVGFSKYGEAYKIIKKDYLKV